VGAFVGAFLAAGAARADEAPAAAAEEPEPEIAPPPPRRRGLVLESGLGALAFFSRFRHVAPVAPWMRIALGYEPFRYVMAFVEGELGFTDTSVAQDRDRRAFAMGGFGAGVRGSFPLGRRVDVFAQVAIGAMKADVANRALADVGYANAESLGLTLGGRVGIDWFQVDRHLALGLLLGIRDAKGFQRTGTSETPLAGDASAVLRYAF
jgi:hypothetical protein